MPPHNSHQKGIDVDFRPMRTQGSGAVTWRDNAYSRDRTRAFIQDILASGNVSHIFFNDPVLIAEFPEVRHLSGHDNHLHVRYNS